MRALHPMQRNGLRLEVLEGVRSAVQAHPPAGNVVTSGDDAVYLTHRLAAFIPAFSQPE